MELERLPDLPVVTGRASIQMMEEFRMFPWAQNTMLRVGQMDEVLREYLGSCLDIDEITLLQ